MTRQAYVLHDHRLVVFWARKAACTSIRDTVLFDVIGVDPERFALRRARKRRWLHDHGYLFDFRAASPLVRNYGYRSIAMIREPYDRLISVFLNTYVVHRGRPVRDISDAPWFAQDFFAEITRQSPGKAGFDYRGLSFSNFVRAVCNRIDRRRSSFLRDRLVLARRSGLFSAFLAPWTPEPHLNRHWNTQIPFWFLQSGFRYDFLYSTDSSSDFFKKLAELTGTPVREKYLNRSQYSGGTNGGASLVDESSLDFCGDPSALNKRLFDSPKLRDRVRRAFEPDYHYLKDCAR